MIMIMIIIMIKKFIYIASITLYRVSQVNYFCLFMIKLDINVQTGFLLRENSGMS